MQTLWFLKTNLLRIWLVWFARSWPIIFTFVNSVVVIGKIWKIGFKIILNKTNIDIDYRIKFLSLKTLGQFKKYFELKVS